MDFGENAGFIDSMENSSKGICIRKVAYNLDIWCRRYEILIFFSNIHIFEMEK